MKSLFTSTLFLMLCCVSFAQEKSTITASELLDNLVTQINEDSVYAVLDKEIIAPGNEFYAYEYLDTNYPDLPKIDGRIVIGNKLAIVRCKLPDYFVLDSLHFVNGFIMRYSEQDQDKLEAVEFFNVYFEEPVDIRLNVLGDLDFMSSHFEDYLSITSNQLGYCYLEENFLGNTLSILYNQHKDFIGIFGNEFDVQNQMKLVFDRPTNNELVTSTSMTISAEEINGIEIEENSFNGKSENNLVFISVTTGDMSVIQNEINGILDLSVKVEDSFIISDNLLPMLDITETSFSETNNWISFKDEIPELIKTSPIGSYDYFNQGFMNWNYDQALLDTLFEQQITENQLAFDIYKARPDSLIDEVSFKKIMKSYYHLQRVFKDNGDISSTNYWYSKMQDVESIWLQYQMRSDKSMSLAFRYYLNRLMKVYTSHGTDPGKAVAMSVWIILGFSLIYLFFPSEWDRESKTKLLQDFRKFVRKNDHGYIKPFIHVLAGFIISVVNALTLSLNSFITLGFGRIPTSGLARYLCIFQGFVGWFLLSLFTVSLINQVLF